MDKLHTEIGELKRSVIEMSKISSRMLFGAMNSLKDMDREGAASIVKMKDTINEMDRNIEENAFKILTLYQPVASDLRCVAASLKIITYLNRIGRYGKDIAVLVRDDCFPDLRPTATFWHMYETVHEMIEMVVNGYEKEHSDTLHGLSEMDSEVDRMRYSIAREYVTYMMENPRNITPGLNYIMVARYLERCGDLSCKIAEKVIYMVEGSHIEIK